MQTFSNPFRPGAGHMPPYLAGRKDEEAEFRRLLRQQPITENMILTGLRGVGKTVLLETLKPIAIKEGWLWVGTDLSESASISEGSLATRLLTDLAVVTSTIAIDQSTQMVPGFLSEEREIIWTLDYGTLERIFSVTPGLVADKLKSVFAIVRRAVARSGRKGIVFAYDEAQNLSDHAAKDQFPLSVLLEVFQSIQRQEMPFMLLLVGLPTLFPKLVEARTYAERMFHVVFLHQLDAAESRDAILRPVSEANCPVKFDPASVDTIARLSGGYPYFIQFICREAFDVWIQKIEVGEAPAVPIPEIIRKLDTDFFSGRWARATDRQRELLGVIARLESSDDEFTVQEIVERSRQVLAKPFSSSHVNQMLASLSLAGLIYKDRHGKYLFAVPLMAHFIRRTLK